MISVQTEKYWVATTPGTGRHGSVLGLPGPPVHFWAGRQMFCLVAQAGFRVPAATDLRKELSFPRQEMEMAAESGQAPKTFPATPPNSPDLNLRSFRTGQC